MGAERRAGFSLFFLYFLYMCAYISLFFFPHCLFLCVSRNLSTRSKSQTSPERGKVGAGKDAHGHKEGVSSPS